MLWLFSAQLAAAVTAVVATLLNAVVVQCTVGSCCSYLIECCGCFSVQLAAAVTAAVAALLNAVVVQCTVGSSGQ
jgi:hypothetical protein